MATHMAAAKFRKVPGVAMHCGRLGLAQRSPTNTVMEAVNHDDALRSANRGERIRRSIFSLFKLSLSSVPLSLPSINDDARVWPWRCKRKVEEREENKKGRSRVRGEREKRKGKKINPAGDPPATIDLNDIGFYDDVSHYDIGGDSDDEICRYHELDDCMICGQLVEHSTPFCPYKKFVPHNVSLPPGIQRICTCCGKRDGHPGEDWEGCAIPKECLDCGTYGKHWTGDADCPTKYPKHQHHEKPDSYQQSGRPLLLPSP